jgi:O-antigen ligase
MAAYRHPAVLIAWSWLGLLVVLFVVRQLAVTADERRCLFAALLATAVALAAQAVYERQVQLPNLRQDYGSDADSLREAWKKRHPDRLATDPLFERLQQRIEQTDARATFVHSDSLAAFLALCLPGLALACVACHRQGSPRWLTAILAGGALLTALALWLTYSPGPILAALLTGLVLALLVGRHWLRRHLAVVAVVLLLLAGLGLAAQRGGLLETSRQRVEELVRQRHFDWAISWQTIRAQPRHTWWGIGPGGFPSHATRYLPPGASEPVLGPHNFVLDTWVASGLLAAVVLLAALGRFFVLMARAYRKAPDEGDQTGPPVAPLRLEFYVGGSLGLLLSFILRLGPLDPEEIILEAFTAGVRSVAWFAAFALLERIVWPSRLRTLALTAGVAALLLSLCTAGGIDLPAVAGPLWMAVGLALSGAALPPTGWLSRPGPARLLTLPVLAAAALIFGVLVFVPVNSSYGLQQTALENGRGYEARVAEAQVSQRRRLSTDQKLNLIDNVLRDLKEAADLDPGDARLHVHQANWLLRRWSVNLLQETIQQALAEAAAAQKLDPDSWAGYQMEYEVRVRYAARIDWQLQYRPPVQEQERARQSTEARKQYGLAAQALERYLPNDPNNAAVHYLLAAAYFRADNEAEGRKQAQRAQELDVLAPGPGRKLTDPQRENIRKWLADGLKG